MQIITIFSISSVQSLSRVWLFATARITTCQSSLSITISWSSLRLTSIESVMPSSHLILGRPLLLLPPIPPSIRVFSNESYHLLIYLLNNHNVCKAISTLKNASIQQINYMFISWYISYIIYVDIKYILCNRNARECPPSHFPLRGKMHVCVPK